MIQVPQPISTTLNFRWFVEYIIDNSQKFNTASAVAKASLLLGADLDTPGPRVLDANALTLLRQALTDEENPLKLPALEMDMEGEKVKCSPRIFTNYIESILHDVDGTQSEQATESKPA